MKALLSVQDLTLLYGPEKGCQDVSFQLYPGEVLGIVGESGPGKSTLLSVLSGRTTPDRGQIAYHGREGQEVNLYRTSEAHRRSLLRTEWGFVEQNPRDGLRMNVSAGANIGERLMAQGVRHYGQLRHAGLQWLQIGRASCRERVECGGVAVAVERRRGGEPRTGALPSE